MAVLVQIFLSQGVSQGPFGALLGPLLGSFLAARACLRVFVSGSKKGALWSFLVAKPSISGAQRGPLREWLVTDC